MVFANDDDDDDDDDGVSLTRIIVSSRERVVLGKE
jgi:hypothetical protein